MGLEIKGPQSVRLYRYLALNVSSLSGCDKYLCLNYLITAIKTFDCLRPGKGEGRVTWAEDFPLFCF